VNLVVTVADLLGAPVRGAEVRLSSRWPDESKLAVADSNGRVEFTGVIDDAVDIFARAVDEYGIFQMGGLSLASLGGQSSVNARIEIRPVDAWWTSAIASAHVAAGGVRDGGRTLEFRLGILGLSGSGGSVRVFDCVPDAANNAARFQPDCVAGAEGFDAPYLVLNNGYSLSRSQVVVCCNDPMNAPLLSSTLLLDQSGTVTSSDPGDARLFAAKYFLTLGVGNRRLSLAAFAANDAASGQPALLPQLPVTIFPVENPVAGAAGRDLFPTVDALASLEGGGAPLYDALDRLIDFAAPGPNEISTIFVVTDGRDTTCGTYSQCKARRQQVLQKSRDRKVTITTIGLSADATGADREALGALSQGSYSGDRAAFWASHPSSLFEILQTAMRNQQRTGDRYEATFQVQAPTAGTFASGRTVIGTVRWTPCPLDCGYRDIPFTVEIP
jgi:hypothetical protein